MANDKKYINELVSNDDDPTAELEAIVLAAPELESAQIELESATNTTGLNHGAVIDSDDAVDLAALRADLAARSRAIGRLEFEVARLQARQLGLEAETKSRDEVITELRTQLQNASTSVTRKQGLLKKRDQQIKALRLEIRERNEHYLSVQQQLQTMGERLADQYPNHAAEDAHPASVVRDGRLASSELVNHELRQRYARLERYADELRRQLQEREIQVRNNRNALELLQYDLSQANERIKVQQTAIADLTRQNKGLDENLASIKSSHAEEIRMVRFELGAAQETLSQHELLTEQLASDLVETRTYRVQLESMLSATEENSKLRIERLEQENQRLRREVAESLQKLETKNEAINCLISELTRKSHQIHAGVDKEINLDATDGAALEPADIHPPVERDKTTRVLVGSVDGQEVRFPLFKDRLTIGRTEQNDIQLKASHISRRHAVIVSEGGVTRVIDWGSKNGVFVNAQRITEHFLKHGDVVSVGTSDFRYEERAKREPRDS